MNNLSLYWADSLHRSWLLINFPGRILGFTKCIFNNFQIISFLRMAVPRSFLLRNILPIFAESPERPALQSPLPPLTDHVSVTRTFCGALFLPTIASFLGKALFDQVKIFVWLVKRCPACCFRNLFYLPMYRQSSVKNPTSKNTSSNNTFLKGASWLHNLYYSSVTCK